MRLSRPEARARKQRREFERIIKSATFCGKTGCYLCGFILEKQLELRDSQPKAKA